MGQEIQDQKYNKLGGNHNVKNIPFLTYLDFQNRMTVKKETTV